MDPKLEIFEGASKVAENDNWDAALAPTFAGVGAFAFATGSRDSAAVVTLAAGKSYTVQVDGVGGATGEALVEIYELPQSVCKNIVAVFGGRPSAARCRWGPRA